MTREDEFELALAQRDRQAKASAVEKHHRFVNDRQPPRSYVRRVEMILDRLEAERRHQPEARA
ncbi:hypothetical protein PUR29_36995 [Methylobacterium ajmalii]|uniref:Uncharacterized protein n=1 Tax=Methylobacterium ajmalii TaxID=2738439 RepID=A0ABV0A5C6_9HYPH